ncbi:MAG: hypothetical protein ABFS14_03060 [Gemmatimonadota bacterium]
MRDAVKLARDYFPGTGNSSPQKLALDLIDTMDDACESGDLAAFTAGWFAVAAAVETLLEAGTAGDPVDGDALMWELANAQASAGSAFDPCGGSAACSPWDGYPTRPDFVGALSAGGAWSVITTGSSAVCSGHMAPCANVDPSPLADGETFGVEPSLTWEAALHGRTSLLFGNPLVSGSPTGEAPHGIALRFYAWNLIPHPDQFDPDAATPAVLEVGLCSQDQAAVGKEAVMQKGQGTILQEAVLGFCPTQALSSASKSPVGRFASWLAQGSPIWPAPLIAGAAGRVGPGGSAGSFTDFFAVEVPVEATLIFVNPPADATAGELLLGADGEAVKVMAVTTSVQSPIENATVIISVELNGGLIPSGNSLEVDPGSETNITCDPQTSTCTGFTQADQEPEPGVLELPVLTTKTGVVRLCVTGQLAPLVFDTVCSDNFNVRP